VPRFARRHHAPVPRGSELTCQKAALWLLAFSLRDPSEQQMDARTHLAALQ
jgi:hypothetical protein